MNRSDNSQSSGSIKSGRRNRAEHSHLCDRVLVLLERKLEMVAEQQKRRSLLATHPRESLRVALLDQCREVDAKILLLDAEFNGAYSAYRATLPSRADGSIDVDALDFSARAHLSRLQQLVQKISALTFQTSQDTVR